MGQFTFLPTKEEGVFFLKDYQQTVSSEFWVFANLKNENWYLHSPYYERSWASFYMFKSKLYFLFCELLITSIFLMDVVFLLSSRSFLHIREISPSPMIWIASIYPSLSFEFAYSNFCLQKIFILSWSNLSIFFVFWFSSCG